MRSSRMSGEHQRFAVTNAPEMAPGNCWITKSAAGPFIDTGADVQLAERGRLYIAVAAIREMAEIAGLFADTEEKIEAAYNRGYEEGTRDTVGNDIRSAVERLGHISGQLTAYLADDEPVAPEAAGTDGEAALPAAAGEFEHAQRSPFL